MTNVYFLKSIFFVLFNMFFLFNANVSATTFSQPQKIGAAYITTIGVFGFEGEISHSGIPFTNKKFINSYKLGHKNGKTIYDKGVAVFSAGDENLYFHYDSQNGDTSYYEKRFPVSMCGDEKINNTVQVNTGHPGYIRVINSDINVVLYLLSNHNEMTKFGGYEWGHTLIGKGENGKFVKFFNTIELSDRFFGNPSVKNTNFSDCRVQGDTIIVKYKHVSDISSKEADESGEFRFKWDNKAQWFGVEKVVY